MLTGKISGEHLLHALKFSLPKTRHPPLLHLLLKPGLTETGSTKEIIGKRFLVEPDESAIERNMG